ncbi:MAG: response regulator, partial [Oscillochloris sp.]|nr:response regulator [Oscillochloris sp.]
MQLRINLTLTHKFIAFLLLAAVLPLLIVGVSAYQVSRTIVREEAIRFTQILVDAQRDYLDLQSKQIASLIANLVSVEEITEALAIDAQTDPYTSLATQARIGYILDGYSNLDGLVSIDIFTLRGDHYHVGDTLDVSRLRTDVIDRLLLEARAHSPNVVWLGIEENINASSNQQHVITAARMVMSTTRGSATSEPVGVLLVNSSADDLHAHFQHVNLGAGALLLIIDAQGRAIYHPDPALQGSVINASIRESLQGPSGTLTKVIDGQTMLLTYTTSSLSGWTVLSVVPIATLNARAATIGLTVLLAFAVACIIVGFAATFASRLIVIPLRDLTRHLQLLQESRPGWETPLPVRGTDEIGELSRWFNTFLETLSARSRAEEALRESEEQNRLLFEESPDAVVLFDDGGRVEQLNRAFERLTGYRAEQLTGQTLDATGLVSHEQFADLRASILTPNQVYNRLTTAEFRLTDAQGAVRDVGVRVFGLTIHGHRHYLSTMRDITTEKQVEETLRRANAELARAGRTKDEFLANMSHELRTPLNAILALSETLQEQITGPLNERQMTSLYHIESSGRHLLALINDILDISKVEAGRLELQMDIVEVAEVCQASLVFVKELALKKSVKVGLQLNDPMAEMEVDSRRLKQMLVNLLSNAVKFTPNNGQVRLEVKVDAAAEVIDFRVRDTGIGMAPEDIVRLFQPFLQLDSSLSRNHEGTGLGLALVRRLAELHGGSVTVESTPGQGSCFTITLPYHPPPPLEVPPSGAALPAPTSEADLARSVLPSDHPAGGGLSAPTRGQILLAEDNEVNIMAIEDYLHAKGYQVVVAHNGREALERADESPPDVILMDIQMPEMDGLEAIRRLRAMPDCAATPVIALTALAMPGDRERCFTAGASEYMTKP